MSSKYSRLIWASIGDSSHVLLGTLGTTAESSEWTMLGHIAFRQSTCPVNEGPWIAWAGNQLSGSWFPNLKEAKAWLTKTAVETYSVLKSALPSGVKPQVVFTPAEDESEGYTAVWFESSCMNEKFYGKREDLAAKVNYLSSSGIPYKVYRGKSLRSRVVTSIEIED